MIASLALLVSCQALGELISRMTKLPLPGTVIGMFLLLAWLAVRRAERPALDRAADWLIAHMSILLLPAAVGVMQQAGLLQRYGLAVGLAAIASTLLTLGVTAGVFCWVARGAKAAA